MSMRLEVFFPASTAALHLPGWQRTGLTCIHPKDCSVVRYSNEASTAQSWKQSTRGCGKAEVWRSTVNQADFGSAALTPLARWMFRVQSSLSSRLLEDFTMVSKQVTRRQ